MMAQLPRMSERLKKKDIMGKNEFKYITTKSLTHLKILAIIP